MCFHPFFLHFIRPLAVMVLIGFGLALTGCEAPAKGQDYLVNVDKNGVILDGYDPVAFFTDNKPVKGDPNISYTYHEATYWFASEEHRRLFEADPARYEPQYGGYCAYAASIGQLAPIDVNTFSIVDGRLMIQHNARAVAAWEKDVPGNVKLADKYWPQIVARKGKGLVPDEEKGYLVNTDGDGVIAEGYDVVAYFTDGKPVKGDPNITKLYKGGIYHFATEEHKQLFGDNPEKYAPQYGSFCAYAVSRNRLRPIDPQYFQIIDGRLMLQHSKQALDLFSEDIPGNVVKADQFWPGLVEKKAGKKVAYDAAVK